MNKGEKELAIELLNDTMNTAVELAEKLCDEEFSRAAAVLREKGGIYGPQKENIQTYCEYAKLSIC